MDFQQFFENFRNSTGISQFFVEGGWKNLIMILIACILLFLAIKKQFEPYLLLPIAFGMLLVNIPGVKNEIFKETVDSEGVTHYSGLIGYLYYYLCLFLLVTLLMDYYYHNLA